MMTIVMMVAMMIRMMMMNIMVMMMLMIMIVMMLITMGAERLQTAQCSSPRSASDPLNRLLIISAPFDQNYDHDDLDHHDVEPVDPDL